MKKKKADILMPAFFLVLAFAIYMYCVTIPAEEAMFLMIVAIAMSLCAGALMFIAIKKEESEILFTNVEIKKVLITLAVLSLYTVCLNILGYIVDTILLGSFIIWYLNPKGKKIPILCGIVLTMAVYYVFGILLGVPMPVPFFMEY